MTISSANSRRDGSMRISIVGINFAPEVTGIAPYTTSLAAFLAKQGHEVVVMTSYPHYPEWRTRNRLTASELESLPRGVAIRRLRHYVPSSPSFIKRILMELSFAFRVLFSHWGRPAVVLTVSPSLIASAAVILKARIRLVSRRPCVITWVQDLYSLGAKETGMTGDRGASLVTSVEGLVLRRSSKVVVIHGSFEEHAVVNLGCSRERVSVVPNWSHVNREPESNREADRAAFGWTGRTIVLHAGNMGVKQGLENVVDAAKFVDVDSVSKLMFFLLGDGGERAKLQNLIGGLKSVEILKPVDDEMFVRMLRAADILLVNEKPGVREMAVPSKLTSYFSSGRPVVAAVDPSGLTAREIQRAGGGVCVLPGRPELLVQKLQALAGDSDLMESLGESGRAYSFEKLSAGDSLSHLELLVTTR